MKNEYDYQRCENVCPTIIPNGVDVCVERNDCKIQANVMVERIRNVLIWGAVTDCMNIAVTCASVKLLKYTNDCGTNLREICQTYTDSQGCYQFDLKHPCEGKYRIMVSPNSDGKEEQICTTKCERSCGDPCARNNRCECSVESRGCRSTIRNNIQYY